MVWAWTGPWYINNFSHKIAWAWKDYDLVHIRVCMLLMQNFGRKLVAWYTKVDLFNNHKRLKRWPTRFHKLSTAVEFVGICNTLSEDFQGGNPSQYYSRWHVQLYDFNIVSFWKVLAMINSLVLWTAAYQTLSRSSLGAIYFFFFFGSRKLFMKRQCSS